MHNKVAQTVDSDLRKLTKEDLVEYVLECREALRYARDQAGNFKCYADYLRLLKFLPESTDLNPVILTKEEHLRNCEAFYDCVYDYLQDPEKSVDDTYKKWDEVCPYEVIWKELD